MSRHSPSHDLVEEWPIPTICHICISCQCSNICTDECIRLPCYAMNEMQLPFSNPCPEEKIINRLWFQGNTRHGYSDVPNHAPLVSLPVHTRTQSSHLNTDHRMCTQLWSQFEFHRAMFIMRSKHTHAHTYASHVQIIAQIIPWIARVNRTHPQ